MRDFYFDTVSLTRDLKKIDARHKNWQVLDFNNDGQPDLFYTGHFSNGITGWNYPFLYLSHTSAYGLVPLAREKDAQYAPLIFTQKLYGKNLLFVYQFDLQNQTIVDSLMERRRQRYPAGIRCADTLVYEYGAVINYCRQPSNLSFDSLTIRFNYQQACRNDSFTVYKNGVVRYVQVWCGRVGAEEKIDVSNTDFIKLKGLIKQIDLENTAREYFTSGTDHSTAILKIFAGKQTISIFDYGMQSSFTLKAIYDLLISFNKR